MKDVRRGVSLPLALAAALGGCGGGDDLPRQEVSGTVTFAGKPLATGSIQFLPSGTGADAPIQGGGALITDGRYRIEREKGLVPGIYSVVILSHGDAKAQVDESADPGASTRPPPELIPARYNAKTALTAEIAKDKPNVKDFALAK